MSTRNDFEILLNPSNSYVIKNTDECVYIAEGPKEVQDISTLVSACMKNNPKNNSNKYFCNRASQI